MYHQSLVINQNVESNEKGFPLLNTFTESPYELWAQRYK